MPAFQFLLRAFCLGLLCVVFAQAAQASEQISVSLDYRVDRSVTSCLAAGEFQTAIRGYLRWDPFQQPAQQHILVSVRSVEGRLEGAVEWRDAGDRWEGQRTFSSATETCAKMSRAMALATAIQIELLASIAGRAEAEPDRPPEVIDEPTAAYRVIAAAPPLPSPPRQPWVAVGASLGVIQDGGNGPIFTVPRLTVILGRPSAMAMRFSASGFGPSAEVAKQEGSAQLDRLVGTVELIRFFRAERRVQPLFALGAGVQDVHVHGISAMPALGAAHDGRVVSALLAAGGGVAFMLSRQVFFVVEADGLLFWPAVTVNIGTKPAAARLNGTGVFASGGVLARF